MGNNSFIDSKMLSKENDEHTVEYWFNKAQESYKGKMYGETVFAVTEAL